MNNSPRMKLLTLCIGAALAQMASLPVLADTAVGVDTVIGNKANPGFPGVGPVPLDGEMTARHSPSGQMYNIPPVKPDTVEGQLSGSVDIGYEHESDQTDYAKRKEYSDPKNGVNLNNFSLSVDSAAASISVLTAAAWGARPVLRTEGGAVQQLESESLLQ